MTNAIGFKQGQIGDLVIQTAVARAYKEQSEGGLLTFGINTKYKDILPLFFNNQYIDDYHIWDGYDNWPTHNDIEYINFRKFDVVFHPMARTSSHDWYNKHHYITEDCLVQGLKSPSEMKYSLNPWFPLYKDHQKTITLSLFPSSSTQLNKTLDIDKCEQLCLDIKKLGYRPIQLGGKFDIRLKNAENPDLSIFEATKLMLSSKLHITADTSFSSIAAGYNHPTIGFYGLNYPNMTDCFSHLPPNNNAFYFKPKNVKDLRVEEIIDKVKDF